MTGEQKKQQAEKLMVRIPFDNEMFDSRKSYEAYIDALLDDAENIALAEIYPFLADYEGIELPKKYYNWQIRAAYQLHSNDGLEGFKSYSENGLSWTRISDSALSTSLLNELVPRVGVPKRRDVEDVE